MASIAAVADMETDPGKVSWSDRSTPKSATFRLVEAIEQAQEREIIIARHRKPKIYKNQMHKCSDLSGRPDAVLYAATK